MPRVTQIINIYSIEDIPSVDEIIKTSRGVILSLRFASSLEEQREEVGVKLKNQLTGFLVSVHRIQPEINICKLITAEEIELNQLFFEQCAKDYRALGENLIFKLADKLKLTINQDCPLLSFVGQKKQIGKVGEWIYFIHGYHCGFKNAKTGQIIEVPLVFGMEFGDLNPYFFSCFIKSTKEYYPLPVVIFEDHWDGIMINEKMVSLGKFERIGSYYDNHFGIAVKGRSNTILGQQQQTSPRRNKFKILFWRLLNSGL